MTTYAIIDAGGEITSVVSVPDEEHLAANVPAGCSAIEGQPPSYSCYYAAAAWVDKPAQPSPYCTWDATSKTWIDARPLAQAQADQTATLTAAYTAAIAQPVAFTSAAGVAQTYQADPQSVSNTVASMLGCQAAQATPAGFFWVALDNTHVPFTYADLQGLAAAMFAQGAVAFAKLQVLKEQVRAATTVDAVGAVVW